MGLLFSPSPFDNESLANYVYRISKINLCNPSWLLNYAKISPYKGIDYFNFTNNKSIIANLSTTCNKSEDLLFNHTIHRFSYGLWNIEGKNLTQAKNYVRYVDMNNSFYCPICISEEPYQRIYWCLKPIIICPLHNTFLIKNCSFCGFPTTPSSLESGICINCRKDLGSCTIKKCSDNSFIQFQNLVYFAFGLIDKLDYSYDFLETEHISYYRFSYSFNNGGHVICNLNKDNGSREIIVDLPEIYDSR